MFTKVVVLALVLVIAVTNAFNALRPANAGSKLRVSQGLKMELFASPSATYNGEIIMPGLKLVDPAISTKPAPEVPYGDVQGGSPFLVVGVLASVLLAAAVPAFLSIGEKAKEQQAGFEESNKIGANEFKQRRSAFNQSKNSLKTGDGNKKVEKKTKAAPAPRKPVGLKKTAAQKKAPAALATEKKSLFSFGSKKNVEPAAVAPKKAGLFGSKKTANAPAAVKAVKEKKALFGSKKVTSKKVAAPVSAAPKKAFKLF